MSDRGDDELQRGWPDDVLVGEEGASGCSG
jgi:hypothetical protein